MEVVEATCCDRAGGRAPPEPAVAGARAAGASPLTDLQRAMQSSR